MTAWTPERIAQATAEWVWVPDDAEEVRTDHYHLIRYPDWFQPSTVVAWSWTDRELSPLIDSVADRVRSWGRSEVFWWVSEATVPADTEDELVRRGAAVHETVTVLAREIVDDLPDLDPPDDVKVTAVRDEQTLRAAAEISAEVWGFPRPDKLDMPAELRTMQRDWDAMTSFRVVGSLDGRPVAAGGCTLAGGAARLWGAATLPAARHRGAYRAVLAERLRLARQAGATLALVKGRIETSGPILRRAGFTAYGEQRLLRLPVG